MLYLLLGLLLLSGDRARGTLAGAGVSLRALSADGQALSVADSAIAADFHQALDIERHFAAKFALHADIMVDIFSEFGYVVFVEVLHSRIGIDTRRGEDLLRRRQTMP